MLCSRPTQLERPNPLESTLLNASTPGTPRFTSLTPFHISDPVSHL